MEPMDYPQTFTAEIHYATADGWHWTELERFVASSIEAAEEQAIAAAEEMIANPLEAQAQRPVTASIELSGERIGYLEHIQVRGDGDIDIS